MEIYIYATNLKSTFANEKKVTIIKCKAYESGNYLFAAEGSIPYFCDRIDKAMLDKVICHKNGKYFMVSEIHSLDYFAAQMKEAFKQRRRLLDIKKRESIMEEKELLAFIKSEKKKSIMEEKELLAFIKSEKQKSRE